LSSSVNTVRSGDDRSAVRPVSSSSCASAITES
jgi:hypothetical protein